ncbi:hypothetical protein [Leisingera sp. ANG59]|uniref:hypothetical protein n=1 Tax=Leisingera sp. ANG59 TaxID=2675221 RepID=UPI0015744971|nr:hypothetical protein [Leisingera sp. ANG59]NSY37554.1 hypothetical protein [Leisingera sp. ANG59]
MIVTCYHGTSQTAAKNINKVGFKASERDGLWIGHGRYFFQEAPGHAADWAKFMATWKKQVPAVFRVSVKLENCIDLIDNSHWEKMRAIYLSKKSDAPGFQPPLMDYLQDSSKVKLGHDDDAWIIELYVKALKKLGRNPKSIRCSIPEGDPLFVNSWLLDKACVMINVLEPDLIVDFKQIQ